LAWREIQLDNADPLFAGLPSRAVLFCSHFDEVVDPPPELRVLARSEICPVHAIRYLDQPAWGVQFHAEIDDWRAASLLAERRSGGYTPHPADREPVPTAEFARRMLANFCAAR
jgi:GMP synthase-like glutamine amidotransferase